MEFMSQLARHVAGSPAFGKVSPAPALLGLGAIGSVQAATLICGTSLRINTATTRF